MLRYRLVKAAGFRGQDAWHFKRGGTPTCTVCLRRFDAKKGEGGIRCSACGGRCHPQCSGAVVFYFQMPLAPSPYQRIKLNVCAACALEWSS